MMALSETQNLHDSHNGINTPRPWTTLVPGTLVVVPLGERDVLLALAFFALTLALRCRLTLSPSSRLGGV